MKVKELINKLQKLPQDEEVCIYRSPNRNENRIKIIDARPLPIKVDEYLCQGSDQNCQACAQGDGYCIYDLDGIQDICEEGVVLILNEDYDEIESSISKMNLEQEDIIDIDKLRWAHKWRYKNDTN